MLTRYIQFVRKHKIIILLVSLGLTVFSGKLATGMTIKADMLELLPQHFKSVQSIKRISNLTGGMGYFIIMFESDNKEKNIQFLKEFSFQAAKDPGILYVDYKNPIEFIQKNGILWLPHEELEQLRDDLRNRINYYRKKALSLLPEELGPPPPFKTKALLEELENKVKKNPYHESKDGKILLCIMKPKVDSNDIEFAGKLVDRMGMLRDGMAEKYPEVKTYFTGVYPMKVAQIRALEADLLIASLFTIIGVSLSLLIFFRSPKAIIIVLLPLIIGLVWTLGINYLIVGHVNLISSFFVSVLLGLGIDYSLQLYSRFKEEYLQKPDYLKAIYVSFITTGKGTLFGALTTFGVFSVLLFSDFLTFKETGLLTAVGITAILISIVIHLPILIFLFKPSFRYFDKNRHTEDDQNASIRLMVYISNHKKKIMHISGYIMLAGLAMLPFIRFEYDFMEIEDKNTAERQAWDKLEAAYEYSLKPSILMSESLEDLNKLRVYLNSSEGKDHVFMSHHMSILNFYPYPKEDLNFRIKTIESIRSMLLKNMGSMKDDDREKVARYLHYLSPEATNLDQYPRSIKDAFFRKSDHKEAYFYHIFPVSSLGMGLDAFKHSKWLKSISQKVGAEFTAGSEVIILEEILDLIVKEGRVILPLSFIVIVLLIYFLFRSVWKTLLVLSPLLMGLYLLGAILGLTQLVLPIGIDLNYLNVVAIPILLGVGIDYSIHIFHRIEEAFGKKNQPLKSKWKEVIHTAQALSVSAITTIIGFSSLFWASYVGLRSIAWVSVLGIIIILVLSSVVMPAMFLIIREKYPKLFSTQDESEVLKTVLHQ